MKYYIVAGEASGDLHGSNLMRGLYEADPSADIRFWGGELMDEVYRSHQDGTGLVRDYRDGAVMGFWEVLLKSRQLLGKLRSCKEDILRWKPDAVILIDYPGFNFKVAEFAHGQGFKVFYYIAPKVWASREGRIRKLKKHVDRLFIIFPFEKDYFTKKGIAFTYKGNPLIDAVDNSKFTLEKREDFLTRNGLDDRPAIALLPGSRKMELSFMLPRLAGFADKLHAVHEYSGIQFIVAGAPGRSLSDYRTLTEGRESFVKVVFGQTYGVLKHAAAAVVNSGTASLEAALIGTPQVVGYGGAWISFIIARQIIRVKYVSLANLIIDRSAFRELLQYYFTPDTISAEVRRLLEDRDYRDRMLADYADVREALGGSGASAAIASAMTEELKKRD